MPTTTTIISAAPRSAGTYTSAAYDCPDGDQREVDYQIVDPNWNTTDDTTISVVVVGEQSFDSGVTWQQITGFGCSPGDAGPKDDPTTPPIGGTVLNDDYGDRLVRGSITISGPLTIGLTLTL